MNFITIDDCGRIHDASDKVVIENSKITVTTELKEDMNQLFEQVLTSYMNQIDNLECINETKYTFHLKV